MIMFDTRKIAEALMSTGDLDALREAAQYL